MINRRSKKIIFSAAMAISLVAAMTFTLFAWFYFPTTQYTTVYTDGILDVTVSVKVYDHKNGLFVDLDGPRLYPEPYDGEEPPLGTKGEFDLIFRSDNNFEDELEPFFFLWGGKYTTNDLDRTIYKVEVEYDNSLILASPTYLDLYGDLDFVSYIEGVDTPEINIRFMKLSCYIPDAGEGDYLTGRYEEVDYNGGVGISFGHRIDASGGGSTTYKTTIYFMVETYLDELNYEPGEEDESDLAKAVAALAEEYGLLDACFTAKIKLYYRTAPANMSAEP